MEGDCMERRKRIAITTILLVVIALPLAAQEIPAGFRVERSGPFTLAWRVAGEQIEVIMAAPTSGWVAVGFGPSSGMRGANIIIGFVDDAGNAVVEDHVGHRRTAHRLDTRHGGRTNVTLLDGSESEAGTRIRFRMPLDSGDEADTPLVRGALTEVIYAWGRPGADNTATIHSARGSMTIQL